MVVSCDICGKQFDSFRGLNGHMNAHLPAHRKRAETFEAPRRSKSFNWYGEDEDPANAGFNTIVAAVKKAKAEGWNIVYHEYWGDDAATQKARSRREAKVWNLMSKSPQWKPWLKFLTERNADNEMHETMDIFRGKAYWKDKNRNSVSILGRTQNHGPWIYDEDRIYVPDHFSEDGGWQVLVKGNQALLLYYIADFDGPYSTSLMKKTFTLSSGKKPAKKATRKPAKAKPKPKARKTTRKKKTGRKAPTLSATKRKIGTRMRGNDGKMWQVKKSGKSQRWMAGAESFSAHDGCSLCGYDLEVSYQCSNSECLSHDNFGAEDYNSFTDEFEALIKKYGQLLEYDTTFHSKERGGDDIMHIHTSFRPNNTDFDNVNFDAESDEKCDRNYHLRCNECRLCLDCNPAADAGGVVCRFCTGDSIERYDAERGCSYSCPDCGTKMYQTNSVNFGSYCACTGCGSKYITKPMNAENWGGDPKGQLAKALQKARATLKKPLNITKLPHPDQKDLIDFEADEWKLLPRDSLGRWQKPVRSESINQLRESLQTSVPAISELLNLYGGDNPNNRYKLYNDLQSLKIDAMDAALPDDTNMTLDNLDLSWMTPQEYYEYILEEPIDVPDDTEDDSTTFEFQERLVRYTAMTMLPQEVEHLIKENVAEITGNLFADTQEAESEINFLNAVRRYQKLSEQWSAE